jgi:hypothetical protein
MGSGLRWVGSRHGPWLGAACVLVLAVVVWLSVRSGGSPAVEASSPEPEARRPPVQVVPPPEPPPVVAAPAVQRPSTPPPSRPAPAEPVEVEVTETPAPPPPEEKVLADPFEPQEDQDAPIRTLVSVGDIQLGVIRESARIRDEAGLKKVLVQIGDELNERVVEASRKEDAPNPQELLDGYREELGKYMDGMVQLSGPGFMVGTEVGPPLPREKWWKPRKQ